MLCNGDDLDLLWDADRGVGEFVYNRASALVLDYSTNDIYELYKNTWRNYKINYLQEACLKF